MSLPDTNNSLMQLGTQDPLAFRISTPHFRTNSWILHQLHVYPAFFRSIQGLVTPCSIQLGQSGGALPTAKTGDHGRTVGPSKHKLHSSWTLQSNQYDSISQNIERLLSTTRQQRLTSLFQLFTPGPTSWFFLNNIFSNQSAGCSCRGRLDPLLRPKSVTGRII